MVTYTTTGATARPTISRAATLGARARRHVKGGLKVQDVLVEIPD